MLVRRDDARDSAALRLERRGACEQGPPKKREAPAKADGPKAVPKKRRVAVVSDGESDAAASSSGGSSGDAEVTRICACLVGASLGRATHICAGSRTAGPAWVC